MTLAASASNRTFAPSLALAALLLGGLTVIRTIGLHYSVVDLFFDESQYWSWSRDLAFGYFSKPPLLAWIIAGSSSVCGDAESCVRSASPILYFGTSLLVYAIAETLYDARTGFWSALIFTLLPGVVFSSRIISTDVPLLFCWSLALLAWVKLLRGPDRRWAVILGAAVGVGMLAKYAMAYFLAGVAIAALFDRASRDVLGRRQTWVALALALLILSPNVLWNMLNGFVTLKHTGDNIQGSGFRLSPLGALEFIGTQFGVVGPLLFGGFLVALVRFRSDMVTREDRLMLAFAIPPLAAITALGFLRNVNANWAAAAFVSATIVVVAIWIRQGRMRLLGVTLAIGLVAQVALLAGDVVAYQAAIPGLGEKGDLYRRTLGWRGLGEAVQRQARDVGAKTVAADGRHELASLVYYLRDAPQPVRSWPVGDNPDNQFDMSHPLTGTASEPILYVTGCPFEARLVREFPDVKPLGDFTVRSGPTSQRVYRAFLLGGRGASAGPIMPLGPCAR
ncbi:glycosyltransferase family 39 protein [Bradyrhizobium sp. LHD-71]|uniref:ArnT family glycosyltransferase n=1 Tax=Bradyrhizobium sp. LHD-71 TaxID=3072141 RepID=UPI00280FE0F5|nr:glycosyltransferase family 39 protein [Bradyrhizobium sp. LHD-71]MDQ8729639.1 glycosyltransferase family 39 protein [Bradyrhizobium sp. LHD-71]